MFREPKKKNKQTPSEKQKNSFELSEKENDFYLPPELVAKIMLEAGSIPEAAKMRLINKSFNQGFDLSEQFRAQIKKDPDHYFNLTKEINLSNDWFSWLGSKPKDVPLPVYLFLNKKYDALQVFLEELKKAKEDSPDKIQEYLNSLLIQAIYHSDIQAVEIFLKFGATITKEALLQALRETIYHNGNTNQNQIFSVLFSSFIETEEGYAALDRTFISNLRNTLVVSYKNKMEFDTMDHVLSVALLSSPRELKQRRLITFSEDVDKSDAIYLMKYKADLKRERKKWSLDLKKMVAEIDRYITKNYETKQKPGDDAVRIPRPLKERLLYLQALHAVMVRPQNRFREGELVFQEFLQEHPEFLSHLAQDIYQTQPKSIFSGNTQDTPDIKLRKLIANYTGNKDYLDPKKINKLIDKRHNNPDVVDKGIKRRRT